MGQFSMEISGCAGSALSGNQQPWPIATPKQVRSLLWNIFWLISAASLSGYLMVALFLIVAIGRLVQHAGALLASRLPRRSQLSLYIVLCSSVAFFSLLAVRGCNLVAVIVDAEFHSDTSPRGQEVPDEPTNWQMGKGAGFYLDATEERWAEPYRMYTYITEKLPTLVGQHFRIDTNRQGIFGHSMGGHGAITIALKNPERFRSCSAFAPIVAPSSADWSAGAFEKYLGPDQTNDSPENWREDGSQVTWRKYDTCADTFLDGGLRPWLFEDATKDTGIELTLRVHEGYDHSYYFISTFMDDHLTWHAHRLG